MFVQLLRRSLKYEDLHLKAYADGHEAQAGIERWLDFYNKRRSCQTPAYRMPMTV